MKNITILALVAYAALVVAKVAHTAATVPTVAEPLTYESVPVAAAMGAVSTETMVGFEPVATVVAERAIRGLMATECGGAPACWSHMPESRIRSASVAAADAAKQHGVSVLDLVVLTHFETRWRPLVSGAGACGITQVMPDTVVAGRPACADLLSDDATALYWGAKVLGEYTGRLGYRDGVAAYNGGPTGRFRAYPQMYADRHLEAVFALRASIFSEVP